MVETPVFASLSINSIFVAKGIVIFSFCKPSRGPTSTSLTRLSEIGCWVLAVAKPLCRRRGDRLQALQTAERRSVMVKMITLRLQTIR